MPFRGQTPPATGPEREPPPPAAEATPDGAGQDDFARPNFNLYLPEGEFDLRVTRLVRNVLLEAQLRYDFVDGDVSTFLRYKYYAPAYTYRIGVFDSIEFDSIDRGVEDFERTRGGLVHFEYPVRYDRRYFGLVEWDALSFGDRENYDHDRDNVHVKLGVQVGTPFDERINAIVGELRGRITPVLTAYREIGPYRMGFGLAVTQGLGVGDYDYTKVEAEWLKRFVLSGSVFTIARVHAGTFPFHGEVEVGATPITIPAIPRYEYFRIGGRTAMKSLSTDFVGSDEIHTTAEVFFPVFRRDIDTWALRWQELYGIGYAGAGNVGFTGDIFTEVGDYIVDAGLGCEALLRYRRHSILLTLLYARTVIDRPGFEDDSVRFSIRTVR